MSDNRIAELEAGLRALYPLMEFGKALAAERDEARKVIAALTAECDALKAQVVGLKAFARRIAAAHDNHTDRLMEQVNVANYYRKMAEEQAEADLSAAIDRIQDMLAGDDGQAFQEARKWLAARGEQPDKRAAVIAGLKDMALGMLGEQEKTPGDCPHCRNGVRHTALGALMACPYCGGSSAGEQLCAHCGTPVFGPGFCPLCDGTGKKEKTDDLSPL